jgi:tRNA-modifying protein YgfZ
MDSCLFAELYRSAREHAAIIDRSARGRIVVSGADRASYLHGLLTNDITALKPQQGCYAAYLTAQGRMVSDLFVYELGDVMLLTLPRSTKDLVLQKLDQFVFSEDVRLADVTEGFAEIGIVGPESSVALGQVLAGVPASALAGLAEHGNLRAAFAGDTVIVARISDPGEPGFDVYVDGSQREAFLAALRTVVPAELDEASGEAIRIEAGIPRFGIDMDGQTIPLEAGIESRAISFDKGCYVGQEVIIRILHRGQGRVVRKLVGLTLDATDLPATGALVQVDGREVGRVTCSTWSPALDRPIALAYLHRDFTTVGTAVSVGAAPAAVATLPFVNSGA